MNFYNQEREFTPEELDEIFKWGTNLLGEDETGLMTKLRIIEAMQEFGRRLYKIRESLELDKKAEKSITSDDLKDIGIDLSKIKWIEEG